MSHLSEMYDLSVLGGYVRYVRFVPFLPIVVVERNVRFGLVVRIDAFDANARILPWLRLGIADGALPCHAAPCSVLLLPCADGCHAHA